MGTHSLKPLSVRVREALGSFSLSDVGWLAVFNLLLFQAPIQSATGFSYIDEGATLIAVVRYASSCVRRCSGGQRTERYARSGFVFLGGVVAIGLISDLFSGVGVSVSPVMVDVFTCIKFFLALTAFTVVFQDKKSLFKAVEFECKVAMIVLFLFGVLNLFVQVGDFGTDPRYGFRASFRFVFGHPESLVFVCVGIVLILFRNREGNTKWIIMTLVVICLSLRSKGIAFAAIALLLLLTWGHRGRLSFVHVSAALLAALAIGWDQYQYYYQSTGFARNELTRVAVQIANRFFPLGSGFATYGSYVTSNPSYYSPLYYEYGLSTVQGLEPGNAAFLSDTFWPIILGQFGWLGFVLFLLAIGFLAAWVYERASFGNQRLAVVLCFAFLLISSTAESAFFHPNAIFLSFCLALLLMKETADFK